MYCGGLLMAAAADNDDGDEETVAYWELQQDLSTCIFQNVTIMKIIGLASKSTDVLF